jgi:hypothetical protein
MNIARGTNYICLSAFQTIHNTQLERTSGAVVARPTPMQKVRGSSPVRDKDFRVRMRRPKYLGLETHALRMRR